MRAFVLCFLLCWCTGSMTAQDIVWEKVGGDGVPVDQLVEMSSEGTLFAKTRYTGLLYRSADRGENWHGVSAHRPVGSVADVQEDDRGHLWYISIDGVFVSDNDGLDWQRIATPKDGQPVYPQRLIVSSDGSIIVLYRSNVGFRSDLLIRSVDYGKSWHANSEGIEANTVTLSTDVAEGPGGEIYASLMHTYSLYRPDNAGLQWNPIRIPLEPSQGEQDFVNILNAVDVNQLGHVFVSSSIYGVYRSLDKGHTWEHMYTGAEHPGSVALRLNSAGDIFIAARSEAAVYRSRNNGATWEAVGTGLEGFTLDGAIMVTPDDVVYISTSKGIYRTTHGTVLDEENTSLVSGRVFTDSDADCTPDANEHGLGQRAVRFDPGPYYAWTDDDGRYTIRLRPAEYTASLVHRQYFLQSCPLDNAGYSLEIDEAGENIENIDFASEAVADIEDLHVSVVGEVARPGFTINYTIYYKNVGTLPFNGRLLFEHDDWFTFNSAEPEPDSYAPNTAVWNIVDLPMDAVGVIRLRMTLDRETPVREIVCSRVTIDSGNEPELLAVDEDEFCHEVRNSFDPNDISVTPAGRLGKQDIELRYRVRFQNTGTAPALRVVVRDTLPAGLNIESLELGAASHDYTFSISGANVATWTFDNINLPDSSANEPESHGYFTFRIKRFDDLEDGTRIPNRVAIYFDYNDPVITNTVENYLSLSPTGVEVPGSVPAALLYPNPADDRLTIRTDSPINGAVLIRDVLGRTLLRKTVRQSTEVQLDISQLDAGTYNLQLPTQAGIINRRLAVQR